VAKAIERIIGVYVTLGNVRALEDMKAQRQKVAAGARGRTDFDFSLLLGVVDDELVLINEALEKLRPSPATIANTGDDGVGEDEAETED
jgi:hypothetical protein